MKFKRNVRSEVGIDLTSLIDVVFILLLFFMLTTSYTRSSGLIINLPETSSETAESAPLRLDILVAADGSYAVNGNRLAGRSLQDLMDAVSGLAAGDTDLPITITADAQTSHQSVVTAMDAVAQLGFTRLNIATRPQAEAE